MSPHLVIGIDPSLSATGIVAIERDGDPGAWRLVFRRTIRPPSKGTLLVRLQAIDRYVHMAVREAVITRQVVHQVPMVGRAIAEPGVVAVAEDPSDVRIPHAGGPSQRFRFGAGAGVAMIAAARACTELQVPFTTYGVNQWLPKQRVGRGGWRSSMRHEHVIDQTRRLIPGTAEATDDETMAAAIALQHVLTNP